MSSSKAELQKFVVETDFIQQKKEAIKKRQEDLELARIEAAKPKISEEDLAAADQTGFLRGVEEGKAQALTQLREEMQEHLGFIHHKIQRTDTLKEELALQFEKYTLEHVQSLLTALFENAKKNCSEELLTTAIKAAVSSIKEEVALTIHMHAESKEYLEKIVPEYLGSWDVNLVIDPQIAPGNCLIEWDTGGVDPRMTHISDKLLALVEGSLSGTEYTLQMFTDDMKKEALQDDTPPPAMEAQDDPEEEAETTEAASTEEPAAEGDVETPIAAEEVADAIADEITAEANDESVSAAPEEPTTEKTVEAAASEETAPAVEEEKADAAPSA